MAKEISGLIKLQIRGGAANPSPPVGPALGAAGVNIMEFCKQFNSRSQDKPGKVLPVVINVFQDRSFDFIIKSPPVSILIKNIMKLEKGSSTPSTNKVGKITRKQLEAIFEDKKKDLTSKDIKAGLKTIEGTAKSMGIEVEV